MATTTESARSHQGPGHPAGPSRDERLAAAHQTLQNGLAELTTSDAWQRMLTIAARFHTYSPSNVLLILAQRPTATRVAGLRTWNSLGRRVNKGEHGIRVIVPILRRDDDTDDNERRVVGFSVGVTFDVSQTSGDPIDPIEPQLLTGAAPDGIADKVTNLIETEGFTVVYGDCRPANGLTSWITNTVTIRDDLEPLAQLKTLLHEAGHVIAHRPQDDADEGFTCREVKEIEAESIAFIVAATLGIDTSTYSFPYVAHWMAGVGELAAVQATAERVITHARHILDHLAT